MKHYTKNENILFCVDGALGDLKTIENIDHLKENVIYNVQVTIIIVTIIIVKYLHSDHPLLLEISYIGGSCQV